LGGKADIWLDDAWSAPLLVFSDAIPRQVSFQRGNSIRHFPTFALIPRARQGTAVRQQFFLGGGDTGGLCQCSHLSVPLYE
jgi:hypothetical protein